MRQSEELKAKLRTLRQEMTPAERTLWVALRAKRFSGAKFSRQVPIEPFIVDFVVRSAKLVVEIDGDTHGAQVEYDARRTDFLNRQGYRVIRFPNADVMQNIEGVLHRIGEALGERTPPLPDPLPASGEREKKA